jgi:hypothetical protein
VVSAEFKNGGRAVAYEVEFPGRPSISKADADLIEAAPVLLEAVRRAYVWLQKDHRDYETIADHAAEDAYVFEVLRRAIAKAEGKA